MGFGNKRFISLYQVFGHLLAAPFAASDVVDSLVDDDGLDASLSQDVTVEPLHGGVAQSALQHAVAADAQVHQADSRNALSGKRLVGHVGPAVLQVGGGAASVGDGVAQGGNALVGCSPYVERSYVVPVVEFLDDIERLAWLALAAHDVAGGARTAVGGGVCGCVAVADGHHQPLQGPQVVLELVAEDGLSGLDGHAAPPSEGEMAHRLLHNGRIVGAGSVGAPLGIGGEVGHIDGLDFHRLLAVLVGELHAQSGAAEAHVDDFTKRVVGQLAGLRHVAFACKFGCRGPGGDPSLTVLGIHAQASHECENYQQKLFHDD